ncbi:LAFA_0F02696g1_1 [Lachancea sp. 'fantastica']|nr:LAFA_0F02696g1_1 [Lachancea sp. 'fantastica']
MLKRENVFEQLKHAVWNSGNKEKPEFLRKLQHRQQIEIDSDGPLLPQESVLGLLAATQRSAVHYKWSVADLVVQDLSSMRFQDRSSEKVSIWYKLMSSTIWDDAKSFDSHIFETLLNFALYEKADDAWRGIALLLELARRNETRCPPVLISVVQERYASSMARVLDQTQDFQLVVNLVRLLIFLSASGASSSMEGWNTPSFQLWEEPSRNRAFFGNSDFLDLVGKPNAFVCDFVLQNMGEFSNVGIVSAACYSQGSDRKNFGIKCIQFSRHAIYAWTQLGALYEFDLRCFDLSATESELLRLKRVKPSESAIRTLETVVDRTCLAATNFLVRFSDRTLTQKVLKQCYRNKISECESFISLQFALSGQSDGEDPQKCGPLALPTPEREPSEVQLTRKSAIVPKPKASMNATRNLKPKPLKLVFPTSRDQKTFPKPLNSNSDEMWDIEPSGNVQEQVAVPTSPSVHMDIVSDHETYSEQSPLVMAQRRRQERAERREKATALKKIPLQTTSPETSQEIPDGKGPANPTKLSIPEFIGNDQRCESKVSKGISKKEISQLDSIFNKLGHQGRHREKIGKGALTRMKRKADDSIATETRNAKSKKIVEIPVENVATAARDLPKPDSSAATTKRPTTAIAESTNLDVTTLTTPFLHTDNGPLGGSFTNQLQDQIFSSIRQFTDQFARKMKIINQEVNRRISLELSQKYQLLFSQLQESFEHDVAQMSLFMNDIKDMLHMPEEELIQAIASKNRRTQEEEDKQ